MHHQLRWLLKVTPNGVHNCIACNLALWLVQLQYVTSKRMWFDWLALHVTINGPTSDVQVLATAKGAPKMTRPISWLHAGKSLYLNLFIKWAISFHNPQLFFHLHHFWPAYALRDSLDYWPKLCSSVSAILCANLQCMFNVSPIPFTCFIHC